MMRTLTEKRFFEWFEDDKSVTLRNKGGVIRQRVRGAGYPTVGALCARDYKGVGNEYIEEGKVIVEEMENVLSAGKASFFTNTTENVTGSLVATDYKDPPIITKEKDVMKVVRRLTPLECERLQGFPDNWTDIGEWADTKGKKHQTVDSARYKALGNSIALPYWKVLARRISAMYDRDITMASLFDGIGGFPFAFEHCGGKAIWASEIEEFPIAVTKLRFPEEEVNEFKGENVRDSSTDESTKELNE